MPDRAAAIERHRHMSEVMLAARQREPRPPEQLRPAPFAPSERRGPQRRDRTHQRAVPKVRAASAPRSSSDEGDAEPFVDEYDPAFAAEMKQRYGGSLEPPPQSGRGAEAPDTQSPVRKQRTAAAMTETAAALGNVQRIMEEYIAQSDRDEGQFIEERDQLRGDMEGHLDDLRRAEVILAQLVAKRSRNEEISLLMKERQAEIALLGRNIDSLGGRRDQEMLLFDWERQLKERAHRRERWNDLRTGEARDACVGTDDTPAMVSPKFAAPRTGPRAKRNRGLHRLGADGVHVAQTLDRPSTSSTLTPHPSAPQTAEGGERPNPPPVQLALTNASKPPSRPPAASAHTVHTVKLVTKPSAAQPTQEAATPATPALISDSDKEGGEETSGEDDDEAPIPSPPASPPAASESSQRTPSFKVQRTQGSPGRGAKANRAKRRSQGALSSVSSASASTEATPQRPPSPASSAVDGESTAGLESDASEVSMAPSEGRLQQGRALAARRRATARGVTFHESLDDALHRCAVQAPVEAGVVFVTLQLPEQEVGDLWRLEPDVFLEATQLASQALLRTCAQSHGYVAATTRTRHTFTFGDVKNAVRFAMAAQRRLLEVPWPRRLRAHGFASTEHHEGGVVFRGLRYGCGIHLAYPNAPDREAPGGFAAVYAPGDARVEYVGPGAATSDHLAMLARGGETLLTLSTSTTVREVQPGADACIIDGTLAMPLSMSHRSALALEADVNQFLGGSRIPVRVAALYDTRLLQRRTLLGPHPAEVTPKRLDGPSGRLLARNGVPGQPPEADGGVSQQSLAAWNSAMAQAANPGFNARIPQFVRTSQMGVFVAVAVPHLRHLSALPGGLQVLDSIRDVLRTTLDQVRRSKALSFMNTAEGKPPGQDAASGAGDEVGLIIEQSFADTIAYFRTPAAACEWALLVQDELRSCEWGADVRALFNAAETRRPDGYHDGSDADEGALDTKPQHTKQTSTKSSKQARKEPKEPAPDLGPLVCIGVTQARATVSIHPTTGLYQYEGTGLYCARALALAARVGEVVLTHQVLQQLEQRGGITLYEWVAECLTPDSMVRDDARLYALSATELGDAIPLRGEWPPSLQTETMGTIAQIRSNEGARDDADSIRVRAQRKPSGAHIVGTRVSDTGRQFLLAARGLAATQGQSEELVKALKTGLIPDAALHPFLALLRNGARSGAVKEDVLLGIPQPASRSGGQTPVARTPRASLKPSQEPESLAASSTSLPLFASSRQLGRPGDEGPVRVVSKALSTASMDVEVTLVHSTDTTPSGASPQPENTAAFDGSLLQRPTSLRFGPGSLQPSQGGTPAGTPQAPRYRRLAEQATQAVPRCSDKEVQTGGHRTPGPGVRPPRGSKYKTSAERAAVKDASWKERHRRMAALRLHTTTPTLDIRDAEASARRTQHLQQTAAEDARAQALAPRVASVPPSPTAARLREATTPPLVLTQATATVGGTGPGVVAGREMSLSPKPRRRDRPSPLIVDTIPAPPEKGDTVLLDDLSQRRHKSSSMVASSSGDHRRSTDHGEGDLHPQGSRASLASPTSPPKHRRSTVAALPSGAPRDRFAIPPLALGAGATAPASDTKRRPPPPPPPAKVSFASWPPPEAQVWNAPPPTDVTPKGILAATGQTKAELLSLKEKAPREAMGDMLSAIRRGNRTIVAPLVAGSCAVPDALVPTLEAYHEAERAARLHDARLRWQLAVQLWLVHMRRAAPETVEKLRTAHCVARAQRAQQQIRVLDVIGSAMRTVLPDIRGAAPAKGKPRTARSSFAPRQSPDRAPHTTRDSVVAAQPLSAHRPSSAQYASWITGLNQRIVEHRSAVASREDLRPRDSTVLVDSRGRPQ